jgi:pyridoxamine 5'-phosphate oxidase
MLYKEDEGGKQPSPNLQHLADLRKDYAQAALDEHEVAPEPFSQFQHWFNQALDADLPEPNAMHLATVGADGQPSGRIVLIKGFDSAGVQFYTNYESRKGTQLFYNPNAALTFFWPELERQIRIEGVVERISPEVSYQYYSTRPLLSRIGAWASPQSRKLASRKQLEELFEQYHDKFEGQEPPIPPYWGGFLLKPTYFEFWQGRRSRLHDRIIYEQQSDGSWQTGRLAP